MLNGDGCVGVVLIITLVVAIDEVHPPTVTVRLYVPAIGVVATKGVGSSREEVKAFGPVQLYVAVPMVFELKLKGLPVHTGELLPGIGAVGIGFTVTVTVAIFEQVVNVLVPVTVYVYDPLVPVVKETEEPVVELRFAAGLQT